MFTGIIEKLSQVKTRASTARGVRFDIAYQNSDDPVRLGESIAINGVCLTVAGCHEDYFSVEAVKETLSATTLGEIQKGALVNLERSLRMGDRLGGHLVFGHIDGVGKLVDVVRSADSHVLKVEFPSRCRRYFAVKGSVALEGVSLTIQQLENAAFTVAIIPHTAEVTNLGHKVRGDLINIEVDMLARYALSTGLERAEFPFTAESLKEQGY